MCRHYRSFVGEKGRTPGVYREFFEQNQSVSITCCGSSYPFGGPYRGGPYRE